MNIEDIMRMTTLTRPTIQKDIEAGHLKSQKIGRSHFIKEEDFKVWMAGRAKRKKTVYQPEEDFELVALTGQPEEGLGPDQEPVPEAPSEKRRRKEFEEWSLRVEKCRSELAKFEELLAKSDQRVAALESELVRAREEQRFYVGRVATWSSKLGDLENG